MEKPKTKVAKSKSSNSTSETKKHTRKNHKKSRSNAEFQANTPIYNQASQPLLKRRGVYVEKKDTKISIRADQSPIRADQSPDALVNKPKPPRPIPRPNRKRFLASVLIILSKSTAGTQCPEVTDSLRKMNKTKSKLKKTRNEEVTHKVSATTASVSKRKPKHRSRVLQNHADNDVEPVVMLQSAKDIAQTPSNNSECITDKNTMSTYIESETLRWTEGLPPLDQEISDARAPVTTTSEIVRLINNKPSTMIADPPKKDDKSFYNFFIDVIKTSFNVYNVETEFNKQLLPSSKSSKVAPEIKESVPAKLNAPQMIKDTEFKETCDVSQKSSSKCFYGMQPDESQDWDDTQLLKHFHPVEFTKQHSVESPKIKRRLKSESFNYKKTKPLPKTNSLPMSKRKTQNDRKKDFINSLKKQLKMKVDAHKEPENFYQALKIIAKNKRRCQQATHIRSWKRPSEGDVHVCQFKRRKVLSEKSSGKQSNYYPKTRLNPLTFHPYFKTRYNKRKIIAEAENEINESRHSLEVVGYDYVTKKKSKVRGQTSSCWVMRAPSPTTLIDTYDLGLLIGYSECGINNVTNMARRQSDQFKNMARF